MNKRLACITLFENEDLEKINNIVSILDEKLCKVPCFVKDREKFDTLPYHITLSTWDIESKDKAIELFKTIKISGIELETESIKIKKSIFNDEDSFWNLYLAIKNNKNLKKVQKFIYNSLPNEKYNPDNFVIHITLHCDKNYEKVLKIQNQLMKNFKSFKIKFNSLSLFEIYPVKRIM